MGLLEQMGIVAPGGHNETAAIFERLFPDFLTMEYSAPSDYIRRNWERYLASGYTSNARNGKILEYLLATLLAREHILPLYLGAEVAFVPNVVYDMLLYSKQRGPISLSAKTSLRERYKQADLEAIALKYVHRRALCFLVTLNALEAAHVQDKIQASEVIGIDQVVVATAPEFDQFVAGLQRESYIEAPTIDVIQTGLKVTAAMVAAARKTKI